MSQRWRLTQHAKERAAEMGLSRWDVLSVIKNADIDHASHNDNRVAKKGTLAVVYDPVDRQILTVLYNTTERWERPTVVIR